MKIKKVFTQVLSIFSLFTLPLMAQIQTVDLPSNFPQSDYTPFGYIDNPYHSAVLNRSGIIRSVPPIGFGFWVRDLPWPYGNGFGLRRIPNYLSFLHLSIDVNGKVLHTAQDFKNNSIELTSNYHTKHMMSYDWEFEGIQFSLKYFLANEHSIASIVEIHNKNQASKTITIHATNIYGYPQNRWWGSDGLASIYNSETDVSVSKIWAYGDIFVIGANKKSRSHKATFSKDDWTKWIRDNNLSNNEGTTVKIPGPIYTVQSYQIKLSASEKQSFILSLTRGRNEFSALKTHNDVLNSAQKILNDQLQEDEKFYAQTPLLVGDWPSEWKHGWIYDWETLRMNIREPVGIFEHHWDGMQIHTPRLVLGETGIDAMCMGYADVELAKDMFRAAFIDVPGPNVACSREDGSVNMICANGVECGTAPIWGVPFFVINSIYQRDQDDAWIKELYPHLKSFLEFWLEQRTDEEGWLHATCSWESGQDGSRRFLISGHDPGAAAEYVRTVDIEAAVAAAMGNMILFAEVAGRPQDKARWQEMAQERQKRVQNMYVDGWFRDFDARNQEPIIVEDYYDIMMFLPVTLGIASQTQMQELIPKFHHFRDNPRHFLEWPSFLFPFTEAAWRTGLRLFTAGEVLKIGNRVYPRLDERDLQPVLIKSYENVLPKEYSFRIPGVSDEFWAINEDNPGGCENYGWGSTFPTLVIRNIIGFRDVKDPKAKAFILAPALPDDFFKTGKTYGMRNLRYRDTIADVFYSKKDSERIDIKLALHSKKSLSYTVLNEQGEVIAKTEKDDRDTVLNFTGSNGDIYTISVE